MKKDFVFLEDVLFGHDSVPNFVLGLDIDELDFIRLDREGRNWKKRTQLKKNVFFLIGDLNLASN